MDRVQQKTLDDSRASFEMECRIDGVTVRYVSIANYARSGETYYFSGSNDHIILSGKDEPVKNLKRKISRINRYNY